MKPGPLFARTDRGVRNLGDHAALYVDALPNGRLELSSISRDGADIVQITVEPDDARHLASVLHKIAGTAA